MVLKNRRMIIYLTIVEKFNSKGRLNMFSLEKMLFMYVGFFSFQLKEETNRDYSFPAGLEDHILGENGTPNMNISGLVPSELTQSNTSLGSSSSSGDAGKLQYSTGMGEIVLFCHLSAHTFPSPCHIHSQPHLLNERIDFQYSHTVLSLILYDL